MNYKFCPNCGKELQPNSNACSECGTILNEAAVREINTPKAPKGMNIGVDKDKIRDNVNSIYNNVKNVDTDKIKQKVGNVYSNAVDVPKSKKKVAMIVAIVAIVTIAIIVLIATLGGNNKNEKLAIQTAENYYSERMGDQYSNLVMESTIASSDKAGTVYVVDISIKSDLKIEENLKKQSSTTVEDCEKGIIIPVIINESGTCAIAPNTNLLDNAYYDTQERQEKLSQIELMWIVNV